MRWSLAVVLVVVAAATVALSGCALGVPFLRPVVGNDPVPVQTTAAPSDEPKIETAATCEHLFGPTSTEGPLMGVINFLSAGKTDITTDDVDLLRQDVDAVFAEQATAAPPLDQYLVELDESIRPYVEQLLTGNGTAYDMKPFKAAATKITSFCEGVTGSSAAPSTEPVPEEPTAKFGDTYTYEDGMEITVSKPTPFEPSNPADMTEGLNWFVRFTVTVKNGTGKRYDPSSIFVTASSGDEEMEEVFDSDDNLNGAPGTTVLPGKTKKYDIGFGSKKDGDLVLEVSPGTNSADESYAPIIYAS